VPDDGWRFVEETMREKIRDGWVVFRKDHKKPPILKSYIYMLEDSTDEDELNEGRKEVLGSVFYRHSQPSNDVMKAIFGDKVFTNPKDHEVLARLIRYVTNDGRNVLILDSFAGSGTTGHAVAALNHQDGGGRRFILVEIDPNIARNITRQRLQRVCEGYTDAKGNAVEGLGSGFRYCRLGKTLLDERGAINGEVPFADLARYVYLLETGVPAPKRPKKDCPLIGVHRGRAVYLLYHGVLGDRRPRGGNVLTGAVLAGLPPHPAECGERVVYGEACRLSEATLRRESITFRQIPYSLREA